MADLVLNSSQSAATVCFFCWSLISFNVQKQWITNQLKLINDQQKKQTVAADCDEFKTKSAILESKKLRLNN
jgi:hypothetical protein